MALFRTVNHSLSSYSEQRDGSHVLFYGLIYENDEVPYHILTGIGLKSDDNERNCQLRPTLSQSVIYLLNYGLSEDVMFQ